MVTPWEKKNNSNEGVFNPGPFLLQNSRSCSFAFRCEVNQVVVTMCTMYRYDDHNSKCCSPLKQSKGYLYTVYNFAGVTKNNQNKGIKKNIIANHLYIVFKTWFFSPSIHHLSKTGDVRRGVFQLENIEICCLPIVMEHCCKSLFSVFWNAKHCMEKIVLDPKKTTILKWWHHLYLENWTTPQKKEAHTHTHIYTVYHIILMLV